MDVWGVGCVFFEIISLFPLFPGNNELDQIHRIHNILGTPNQRVLDRFKK
jgi:renal tumor antigen